MTALSDALSQARKAKITDLPAKNVVAKIYSGYIEDDKEKKKISFSPSGLFYGSGACARRWVLSFDKGLFQSKAGALQFAGMHNGTLAHQRIQNAMLRSGLVTEEQVEVEVKYEDPPIWGFADCILEVDGVTYLGEIKTTKHQNFDYRRNTGKIADYHLAQMLIYMYILDLPNGMVIYESKDTNELHAITLEMTPERRAWVESTFEWCRKVWAFYKREELPAMSFRKNSKVCQACPVELRCYNSPEGTQKVERLGLPE